MWTNIIDSASLHLCRGIDGIVGFVPVSCQVNAGRPALWATIAILAALVVGLSFALRRRAQA